MNNDVAISIFMLFQVLSVIVLSLEWDSMSKDCSKRILAGRLFIFFLPSLVMLSLLIRPLE